MVRKETSISGLEMHYLGCLITFQKAVPTESDTLMSETEIFQDKMDIYIAAVWMELLVALPLGKVMNCPESLWRSRYMLQIAKCELWNVILKCIWL